MDSDSIILERANFARELEYIKEDLDDYGMDDRLDRITNSVPDEDDYRDENEVINQMDPTDDTRETELERLLSANRNMSFEDMIMGVDTPRTDDESPIINGSECGDKCNSPVKSEEGDDNGDATKDMKKEADDMQKMTENLSKQAEKDITTEKYIDMLDSATEYLQSIAESWDMSSEYGDIISKLVIESVFDTDDSVLITIEKNRNLFDGKRISIYKDKQTGEISTAI